MLTKDSDSITIKRISSVEEIETMTKANKKFSLRVLPEDAMELVYENLAVDSVETQNKVVESVRQNELLPKSVRSNRDSKSSKVDHYNFPNSKNRGKIGKIVFNKQIGKWEIKGKDVMTVIHKHHGYLRSYANRAGMIIEE
jgi:hypothetical protein